MAAFNSNSPKDAGNGSPKKIITPQEYFTPEVDLNGRDIGRPKKINTKVSFFFLFAGTEDIEYKIKAFYK